MKKITATLTVAGKKPRNPLVAPARFRQAGSHGMRSPSALRQQAQRSLRGELKSLHPPSP